jgi:hypothetical protein
MFFNAGMLDCTASGQSGTEMYENAVAGSSPVPELREKVCYWNASVPA